MDNLTPPGRVPTWDRADRLRKAMRDSGTSVHAMADFLQVNRNTVSRYTNGHADPSQATLIAWSIMTGVSLEWLRDGTPGDELGPPRRARAPHLHPMRRVTDYATLGQLG